MQYMHTWINSISIGRIMWGQDGNISDNNMAVINKVCIRDKDVACCMSPYLHNCTRLIAISTTRMRISIEQKQRGLHRVSLIPTMTQVYCQYNTNSDNQSPSMCSVLDTEILSTYTVTYH